MPTARELLEQADALMRRNRSAAADDIPVLTEAVSPPPVLRVPLRPSPESPPLPPMEEAPAAAPDVIPTLTDKVPPGEPAAGDQAAAEGEPSDWLDFEEGEPSITGQAPDSVLGVPEIVPPEALREAADAEPEAIEVAEEIEIAPAAEADFEAELGGAALAEPDAEEAEAVPEPAAPMAESAPEAADAEASAPPRVPWPATELPPEIEALPALAAEAEMVFESPSSVSWNVEAALAGDEAEAPVPAPAPAAVAGVGPVASDAQATATAFAAPAATEADEPALPVPAVEPVALAPHAPAPTSPSDDVSLVPSPAEAFAEIPAAPAESSATPADVLAEEALGEEVPEVEPGALAHAAPAPVPVPHADAAPPAAAPADDARWEAMAEEIRMQVLQRIDLFTDTGLREQLGTRLQPIVDRASADLVRTINQHVGELLRAYVAEAIEREIERWRSSQK